MLIVYRSKRISLFPTTVDYAMKAIAFLATLVTSRSAISRTVSFFVNLAMQRSTVKSETMERPQNYGKVSNEKLLLKMYTYAGVLVIWSLVGILADLSRRAGKRNTVTPELLARKRNWLNLNVIVEEWRTARVGLGLLVHVSIQIAKIPPVCWATR